jgi:large subunit ribosomal protein L10
MSERAIAEKRKAVEEVKEKIMRANVMLLSDYLGYTVKEITDLRKKLRTEEAELCVIKNTLMERAVAEAGYAQLKDFLKGSTAVLLGYKDAVTPVKVLVKFIKDAGKGNLRAGVVEKTVLNADALNAMAKLPSREVLLARLVGSLQSPIYGLVNVLQGPLRKMVYALEEIKKKKGGE